MIDKRRTKFKAVENIQVEPILMDKDELVIDLPQAKSDSITMNFGVKIPVNICMLSNNKGKTKLAEDLFIAKLEEFKYFLQMRHGVDFTYHVVKVDKDINNEF